MTDLEKTTESHPDQKPSKEIKTTPIVRAFHRHWWEARIFKLKRPGEGEFPNVSAVAEAMPMGHRDSRDTLNGESKP